ncbi:MULTISPECIES: error-prone DNA polymerase [unclassified Novosphingobium]|uniref:error-prone DNA polymerase n=1 Tax=unclassified Novosphingobium TaxID=2644732 RepID=UPI00144130F0|nr:MULTISPECIES: error-prone DNA polymerase [unclassified Novosphingobium]MBB3359553.1 error-prone DNA polymerase [Novosphingobium sp. BK256]MBB3376081.1 error-prone DNA polymerase [Novosphingobium sp. BK280]MBB3380325.1 error-prone DNA polymerase [Novosphingobium sp. BK258]MBB3422876.1 error-prone DNA polymerase [Novosphingobium sp. BK267]MBB3450846.1 error-prone DNA polymerase [Novosphingobium sp. BK352]
MSEGADPLADARYVELQVTTHFSFLRGASSPEELATAAANLGLPAIGITDRNSFGGLVRAWDAQKVTGIRTMPGARLDLVCGTSLLIYPTDKPAYARLSRLLTIGKRRAGKGACHLHWADLEDWHEGLIAILVPDGADAANEQALQRLARLFGNRAYMALTLRRRPKDAIRLRDLAAQAAAARVPTVATGDVLYHSPDRRMLQDVVTCIREGCTIDTLGKRRERFADRDFKTADEMERLFRRYLGDVTPVHRSVEIARRCSFDLGELTYTYPDEVGDQGLTPQQELERLTWKKAPERYPQGVSDKVRGQLLHELKLIAELAYAPYFLTVHSIVRFARSRGILCQGRGSAANSAVCFVLGITSIDPVQSELLFERFVSAERREPPDIDVDFEHERREEVIQWIYETYGRDRAALTAVITRFRARGAVRDVGKALGLSEDICTALSGQVWGWSRDGVEEKHAQALNLDLEDRRLQLTLELASALINTPRHTSQHPGGFVLSHDRLDELVPIEPAAMENRQIIEWDKDDIDALGLMKVDVLGLGMLGCMRRAFVLLEDSKGITLDLATIPREDPRTYAMIRKADTLGTFQIESRAQMAMLPRIKPTTFYDLVVQVAIVRPGPIQGDMVHPYLRRREGKETITYPTEELRRVLEKTLGVPLFQEQAMRVAIECAGFTASEADLLRRAMATFKLTGGVSHFRDKLIDGMVARGYTADFAEKTFTQIEGFGSYGFPESHAASFALIAYASAWMKCHHPDVFCAALLNAQPMGFYAPAQIVRDAREHGVEVRPVDVNHSRWDCTLEPTGKRYLAVRLGLCMVRDLKNADGAAIVLARRDEPYGSVEEIQRRALVSGRALERIGQADGFGSLDLSRRKGLWSVKGLGDAPLPLFVASDERAGKLRGEAIEPEVKLVAMREGEEVVEDYRTTNLSLKAHPVSFLRADLQALKMVGCGDLVHLKDGRWINLAGIVLIRQKPGSAKGVMFITLEDETGVANLVVWPSLFEKHRQVVLGASMIGVRGQVQREGDVIHVVAQRLDDLSPLLASVGGRGDAGGIYPVGRADVVKHGSGPDRRDPEERPLGRPARNMFDPDLALGSGIIPGQPTEGIKVRTRDFR